MPIPVKYKNTMSYTRILFTDNEVREFYRNNPDELDKCMGEIEELFKQYGIKRASLVSDAFNGEWLKANAMTLRELWKPLNDSI